MSTPKISVIIPLYNAVSTLRDSVESVEGQTFQDWEIIFFDDGSSDGTGRLAFEFVKKNPSKIFYFQHEDKQNHGAALTRNLAADKAKGEFIAFLDADDIWLPEKLDAQLKILQREAGAAMVWGPVEYFYSDRSFVQPTSIKKTGLYQPPILLKDFMVNLWGTPCPSASLLRKSFFLETGGFEKELRLVEDAAFWMKAAASYSIFYDERPLVRYRRHANSSTSIAGREGKKQEYQKKLYAWLASFLTDLPPVRCYLGTAAKQYHSALYSLTQNDGWLKKRTRIFNELKISREIFLRRLPFYLLDCVMPVTLSKRISFKIQSWLEKCF